MKIITALSALAGAVIGFAAAGFGAAALLGSVFGHREGSAEMSGFFGFGPIGALAGTLLGAGLALRFGGGSVVWGLRLMVTAGVVGVCGGLLLAVVATPDRGPSYSYVIEFELEYPEATLAAVNIPSSEAMWGAAGADLDDHPISQFFDKKCDSGVCVLNGSVAALGPMSDFRIAASIGPKKYRYPLNLPLTVTGPVDWTEWTHGEGARVRWRIVRK